VIRYIVRRVIFSIPVILLASVFVFFVVKKTGNPIGLIRNGRMSPHQELVLIHQLGLDKSGFSQYISWLSHFARGDWGSSIFTLIPVRHDILQALANSAVLGLTGVIVALLIGAGIGIVSAVKQYSWFDNIATGGAFLGLSLPNFWFALLLQVFFGLYLTRWLHSGSPILPTQGMFTPGTTGFHIIDRIKHLILPATVLAVQIIAVYSRLMRASMLEILHADYMRTARAKGLRERRVLFRHGVRNALIPLTTQFGIDLGTIAAGLIITETIFSWPGMGQYFINAMSFRDYPQILAWVMIVVTSVIIFNLLVDIVYAVLDPRIRYA
jgi:peptide/nickel transport system permease protein